MTRCDCRLSGPCRARGGEIPPTMTTWDFYVPGRRRVCEDCRRAIDETIIEAGPAGPGPEAPPEREGG